MAKETIVTVYDDGSMEVVTTSKRWINQLNKLVIEGHAELFETDMTGQAYQADASLLKVPYYRKPAEYTKEQRKAAGERLAAAREAMNKPKTKKPVKK